VTARPAAGKGGTSKRSRTARPAARAGASVPTSRQARMSRARAAGRAGSPAPAWIDDAELLEAYSAGADEAGSSWVGDSESDPATDSDFDGEGSQTAVDASTPSAQPVTPEEGFEGGSGRPDRRRIGPIRATGKTGDVAGAFLGFIGAAFITNVIKGTWTQWLRAKFLNDTPTSSGSTDTPNFWQNATAGASSGAAPSTDTPNFWSQLGALNPSSGTPAPGNPYVLGRGDLPAGGS